MAGGRVGRVIFAIAVFLEFGALGAEVKDPRECLGPGLGMRIHTEGWPVGTYKLDRLPFWELSGFGSGIPKRGSVLGNLMSSETGLSATVVEVIQEMLQIDQEITQLQNNGFTEAGHWGNPDATKCSQAIKLRKDRDQAISRFLDFGPAVRRPTVRWYREMFAALGIERCLEIKVLDQRKQGENKKSSAGIVETSFADFRQSVKSLPSAVQLLDQILRQERDPEARRLTENMVLAKAYVMSIAGSKRGQPDEPRCRDVVQDLLAMANERSVVDLRAKGSK
jgi:hypothetical protein